jgi:hypothetical protein
MDELFKESGADWVWKKPMPSNSIIVNQLRSGLRKRKATNEYKKIHSAIDDHDPQRKES